MTILIIILETAYQPVWDPLDRFGGLLVLQAIFCTPARTAYVAALRVTVTTVNHVAHSPNRLEGKLPVNIHFECKSPISSGKIAFRFITSCSSRLPLVNPSSSHLAPLSPPLAPPRGPPSAPPPHPCFQQASCPSRSPAFRPSHRSLFRRPPSR